MRRTPCLLALIALQACALDEPGAPTIETAAKEVPCEDINCPGNSNILAGLGVYELSMKKDQVSPRGFTFDKDNVTQPGAGGMPVKLTGFEVVGASLHAIKQGLPIQDAALIRAVLRVHHTNGKDYKLEIVDYLPGVYYDGTSNLPVISGYYIRYQDLSVANAAWRDLCPFKDYDDPRPGVAGTYAVFWKGERYDPATGMIFAIDDEVGAWFNISCAGEATIKMIRARASGAVSVGVPQRRRQATLNMFTAKYCPGSAQRYTHLGVALDWLDKTGPNGIESLMSYEALWNEDGAVCLSQPRSPEDGLAACRLDTCSLLDVANWKNRGELLSVNPWPPP